MYEGEIVGEFKPSEIAVEQLGLYMAGAKRDARKALSDNEGGEGNYMKNRLKGVLTSQGMISWLPPSLPSRSV